MIESYILLGTLGVHSIEDLRERKITVSVTIFSGIIGIFLHLFFMNQSIFSMLAGMVLGMGIMGLSKITKGKIGMGDGVVFMLTGLYLGFSKNLMLMGISFFLAGIWGIIMLSVKLFSRNVKIPLVPFLFIGYGLMMWGGKGI